MKTLIATVLGGLVMTGVVRGQEPATTQPATTQPATTQPDAGRLLAQLGDDDFHIRDQASQALRKMGKDALPLLAKAKNSPDPEVQRRADMIGKQIDADLHPMPKLANVPPGQGGGLGGGLVRPFGGIQGNMQFRINAMGVRGSRTTMSVRSDANGTVKDMTAVETDKTVVIHEDHAGIKMTVTQKKEGKDASDEYEARDADTLKKEHPDVYPLYEKYMTGMQIKINNLPAVPRPPVAP
jgi:hypothetical protein